MAILEARKELSYSNKLHFGHISGLLYHITLLQALINKIP